MSSLDSISLSRKEKHRQNSWLIRIGLTRSVLLAAALALVLLLVTYNDTDAATTSSLVSRDDTLVLRDEDDLINLYATLNRQRQRCLDDDDPPSWYTGDDEEHPCTCTDPTVALKRVDKKQRKQWMVHHDNMVATVQHVQRSGLDVVFFGDSITERWMGTKAMGKVEKPEFRSVFETYFSKDKGGILEGKAFGTGGDTSRELLWHLQNGLLPKRLQPRAILLLIGTNDLGLPMCSKKNALAGILHVATFLGKKRPEATIILHGLTPRNEFYGDLNFDLGVRWKQIEWINHHLRKYAERKESWFYIENPGIFLRHGDPNMINATLMKDALHPTVQGYKLWAPRLAQQIYDILEIKK